MKAWIRYPAAAFLLAFGLSVGVVNSTARCYQFTSEGRAICRHQKDADLFYKSLDLLLSGDPKYLDEHQETIVRSYEAMQKRGLTPVFGIDSMELRYLIRDIVEQKLGQKT